MARWNFQDTARQTANQAVSPTFRKKPWTRDKLLVCSLSIQHPALSLATMLRLATRIPRRPALYARAIHARGLAPTFSFFEPPAEEERDKAETAAVKNEQRLLRLNAEAVEHHNVGHLSRAQSLFEQLVDGRREHNGELHPHTIYALGWLADVCRRRGDLAGATSNAREAVSSARATLGSAHADTLGMITNLSTMLQEQGKLAEAEKLGREVVKGYRKREPDGCEDTLSAISVLSQVLLRRGKAAEAEPFLRQGLRLSRRLLGSDHPHSLTSAGQLAQLLADKGEHHEAQQVLMDQLSGVPEAQQLLREQLVAGRHELGERL